MKMTPALLVLGSLLVFWAAVVVAVLIPADTMPAEPSASWRPWSEEERAGHRLYVTNGCSYCHSLYVRRQDWGLGAWRLAEAGDYHAQEPAILGSARTGPDLSQAGGLRPDDWHLAHFVNPRFTRPNSLMPSWAFLDAGDESLPNLRRLTAFVQSLGGREADQRMERQRHWQEQARRAHRAGTDANVVWLHEHVPEVWRRMPNPYPADPASLERGRKVYQDFCTGCHGEMGDGQGPAAPWLDPPPLDFTVLRRHLVDGRYLGGLLYYQVMNGITGTAMPYFKNELESERIWEVANYVAVTFVGYTDANLPPEGIDAAHEPPRGGTGEGDAHREPGGEDGDAEPGGEEGD